jgi:daunorubicin resistance ABC transporter ATP-binding subunit
VTQARAIVGEQLRKRFGQTVALDGVDLDAQAGTVLGVLGPNGAGKTTLVRILATLLVPDSGRAAVDGLDVVEQAHAVRRRIGLAGQYAAVDGYLTGAENLVMIGCLAGLARRAAHRRADDLLQRFDLVDFAGRQVQTYSGGMRRRLDLAASLVASPSVLFLDEPTTGLDPHGRIALWKTLAELKAQGTTLLLTTQYMEEADRLADHIVIIDAGTIIAEGTPDQLKTLVGGDRLEVTARRGYDPRRLAEALDGLGAAPPAVNLEERRVSVPVDEGSVILVELSSRLARADVAISDLALRRPTLDDVFLALTSGDRHRRQQAVDTPPATVSNR